MILPSKRRIERWNVWDYPKGLNCMLYDYEKVAQEERRTRKCVIGWMIVRVRFLPLSFIWIFPKKYLFFTLSPFLVKRLLFWGVTQVGWERLEWKLLPIWWCIFFGKEDEMEVNRSISVSQKIQVDSQKKSREEMKGKMNFVFILLFFNKEKNNMKCNEKGYTLFFRENVCQMNCSCF